MTKENGIVAWSYSRLALYEQCPFKFKSQNIDKEKAPFNEAMGRGNKIHLEAAKFLDGSSDILPNSCIKFSDEFYDLKELSPMVEQQWVFNKNWKKTTTFHKTAWLRSTVDAGLVYGDGTADIVDHKTGKFYAGSYDDQMKLFAGVMVKKFPTEVTKSVTTRLWFLDQDHEEVKTYSRDEALDGLEVLVGRAEKMMGTERFPAKPNMFCPWCHLSSKNDIGNGKCKF